ncbi:hypothetical protein EJB05_15080, partial [Eragrostis curvula]
MAAVDLERGPPDADSDDERPEKEPEFVIHVVEDHHRPPPRPRQMHRPLPAAAPLRQLAPFPYQPTPRQPAPELDYSDVPKECTNCFICKIVHCILVIILAAVTLMLAAGLPEKYKEGDGGFIMVCPIFIGVVALSWLMLAKYDKEQC